MGLLRRNETLASRLSRLCREIPAHPKSVQLAALDGTPVQPL
jgi:hypothetical protein